MIVYDSARKLVNLGAELHRGGEGVIYAVTGQPSTVAKIFTQPPPAEYMRKLAWMRDNPPTDPGRALGHASIAWPGELVFDAQGSLNGYLMPLIANAVPILDVFNPHRRARTLPRFDRRYLHRAARNLAAAVGALHGSGYVIGDLNESNVLVTQSALVTLIDADSFQVSGDDARGHFSFPCPVGKPEYTPPELQGKPFKGVTRLPEHDCFGLGVLVFQLLMEGSHPFRAQWLGQGDPPSIEERIVKGWFPHVKTLLSPVAPPPNTPALNTMYPELVYLVTRCFVDGQRNPELRPSPKEWEQALREAERALIVCPNGHYYSNHLAACPECGAANPRAGEVHAGRVSQSSGASQTVTRRSAQPVRMRERVFEPVPPPAGAATAQGAAVAQQAPAPAPVAPAPAVTVPVASAPALQPVARAHPVPVARGPNLPQVSAVLARLPRVSLEPVRAGVLTWFIWSLANAASWPMAFLIGESVGTAMGTLGEYALIGTVIGLAQWFALRGRVRLASGWALVTWAGLFLGQAVDRAVDRSVGHDVGASMLWPVTCILLVVLQWRFLRTRVNGAHWWIVAGAAGWIGGLAAAQFVPGGMFLAGLVYGAAGGIVLALLLARPRWFARAPAMSWRTTAILLGLVLLGIAAANALLLTR